MTSTPALPGGAVTRGAGQGGHADRAALLGIACAWESLTHHLTLTGMSEQDAHRTLTAAASEHMAPEVREAATFRLLGLIDAVETVRGVHEGWIDPAEIVPDEPVWHDRAALAEDAALSAVEDLIADMTTPLGGAA